MATKARTEAAPRRAVISAAIRETLIATAAAHPDGVRKPRDVEVEAIIERVFVDRARMTVPEESSVQVFMLAEHGVRYMVLVSRGSVIAFVEHADLEVSLSVMIE